MKFKAVVKTDPEKKKKARGGAGNNNAQVVQKGGQTTIIHKEGDMRIDNETLKADREYIASRRGTGDTKEHYSGQPTGPRVGGKAQPRSVDGPLVGGTKKQIRASKIRVRKNAASPAAKRSAMMIYRKK